MDHWFDLYISLPILEFSEITPPIFNITGNNSYTIEDTIVTPIKNQINGVQNIIYIQSFSVDNGSFRINISFEPGTHIDITALDI
ncbi:MAG: efflux RND transporter permease subunit [Flavobacteriales bacterium AspAUS03]